MNKHEEMVSMTLGFLFRLIQKESLRLSKSDKEDAMNTFSTTLVVLQGILKDEYKPLFEKELNLSTKQAKEKLDEARNSI